MPDFDAAGDGQDLAGLAAVGLYFIRGFLEPEVCARLVEEASRAPMTPAGVVSYDGQRMIDSSRRTLAADAPLAKQRLDARMADVLPEIEAHFGERLVSPDATQLLVYGPGDFFRTHRDNDATPGLPDHVLRRRASVVVFLNSQGNVPEDDEGFCGGSLMFFRPLHSDDPERGWREVRPEHGLLVAFPSNALHEVRPVRSGRRYTAVSWFLRPIEET